MIAQRIKNLLPAQLQQITYIGELPTDINLCAAISEQGGPHGTYFNKDQLDEPYIKITVRAQTYVEGYELVRMLKQILTSYADARLLSIILVGDIMYFGRDDSRRNIWQLTYRVFSIE